MKKRAGVLLAATALLGPLVLAASCATTDDQPAPPDTTDASSVVPAIDAAEAGDGGCDADACAEPAVSCVGIDWCPQKTGHSAGLGLAAVWGSGPNDVWTVGAFGSVSHWDGTQWASVPVPSHASLRAVWGSGPNDVWAVAAPDQIFHSKGFANGTATWSAVAAVADISNTPPTITAAVWGTSSSDVWVGGGYLPVQRGDDFFYESGWRSIVADGGAAWAPTVQDFSIDTIRGIWGSGPGDVWIVGSKSDHLPFASHSAGVAAADGGVPTFTERDTQTISGLYAVWGSGPNDVWAVGDFGTIRHITAGATVWSAFASPTSEHLRSVWGSGPNDVWAVGENGTVIHYDGKTWRTSTAAFAPGDRPHLYGVWGSGPNDVWAVGSGVVIHFTGPAPDAQGAP